MEAPSIDERIKELEMTVTYQDDVIETLNQVVIELRRTVDALAKRVETMDRETSGGSADALPHEQPPHY